MFEKNILRYFVPAALFIIFTLYVLLVLLHPLNQDEAVFLTIAQNWHEGFLPYKDLFDHKPLGIYALFALIYFGFKNNIIAYEIILILSTIISAYLLSDLANKINANKLYVMLVFICLNIIYEGYYLIAEVFMVMLILIAVWLLLKWQSNWKVLIIAGIALGLSLLFKQTAILSIIAAVIYLVYQREFKKLILIIVGAAFPLALTLIYLLNKQILDDAYRQVIIYTLYNYPPEAFWHYIKRHGPYFLFSLPIWFSAFLFLFKNFSKYKSQPILILIILLLLLPIPAFVIRHYAHYWLQIIPFLSIFTAAYFNQMTDRLPNKLLAIIVILTFVSTLSFAVYLLARQYPKYQQEAEVTKRIKMSTECIYTENQFVGFYFLADKRPISKYLYITEINNWSEQAEVKAKKTLSESTCQVLWPLNPDYAYAKDLQSYIDSNYQKSYNNKELGLIIFKP